MPPAALPLVAVPPAAPAAPAAPASAEAKPEDKKDEASSRFSWLEVD